MSRVKQASKQKRTTKAAAVKVLGAAGLSFSLVGSASASTMPTAGIPQSDNTSPNQRFVLSEEEMADVSLATFYVFDKENVGSGVQLARGCGGCGRMRRRVRRLPWLRRWLEWLRRFRVRWLPRLRRLAVAGSVASGSVAAVAARVGVGCAVGGGCCGSWGACRLCNLRTC